MDDKTEDNRLQQHKARHLQDIFKHLKMSEHPHTYNIDRRRLLIPHINNTVLNETTIWLYPVQIPYSQFSCLLVRRRMEISLACGSCVHNCNPKSFYFCLQHTVVEVEWTINPAAQWNTTSVPGCWPTAYRAAQRIEMNSQCKYLLRCVFHSNNKASRTIQKKKGLRGMDIFITASLLWFES